MCYTVRFDLAEIFVGLACTNLGPLLPLSCPFTSESVFDRDTPTTDGRPCSSSGHTTSRERTQLICASIALDMTCADILHILFLGASGSITFAIQVAFLERPSPCDMWTLPCDLRRSPQQSDSRKKILWKDSPPSARRQLEDIGLLGLCGSKESNLHAWFNISL